MNATPVEDDDALVARARGDRAAFALIYRRYVDAVYRYCYRRLGNREAAEDATSTVFEKVLAALPTYRDDSFRGWLFTIAHNVVANTHRSTGKEDRLVDVDIDTRSTTGPEELVVAAEARATVRAALAELPPDQRHLLELRLAGLSGPEIARVLGRSHGSVKVAQFRAISRLRRMLGVSKNPRGDHDASR